MNGANVAVKATHTPDENKKRRSFMNGVCLRNERTQKRKGLVRSTLLLLVTDLVQDEWREGRGEGDAST